MNADTDSSWNQGRCSSFLDSIAIPWVVPAEGVHHPLSLAILDSTLQPAYSLLLATTANVLLIVCPLMKPRLFHDGACNTQSHSAPLGLGGVFKGWQLWLFQHTIERPPRLESPESSSSLLCACWTLQ